MSLLKYLTFGNKNSYTLNENQQSKSKTGGDKRGLEECSQPPKKRLKSAQSDSKELSKDQKYEEKRERKFLEKWLADFPWLLYKEEEDLMFCRICLKYPKLATSTKFPNTIPVFVTGSNNFRIEPIRSHEKGDPHKKCATQYLRDEDDVLLVVQPVAGTPVKESPILKAISNLGEKEQVRMRMLFNCAYSIALQNRPFSDMSFLCSLMKKNGVEIGENYDNNHGAREFIAAIAETLQQDATEDIKRSPYISILADGSTDTTIKEQEIVYVRYISDGEAKTRFVSLEELNSSDAKGVKEGIDTGLNRIGLNFSDIVQINSEKPTLVCANFDGASVMQGLKSGTMSMILKEAPWVIPMHCVAHKLELAALDSIKGDSYMRRFEDTVKEIYMFYHYSPKRRREVKSIAEFMDSELAHISGIKQVRWLSSKTRALTSLKQNYAVIVSHLEHVAARSSTDEAARAKGYLKDLMSIKFVMMLHAMVDILSITAELSQAYQRSDLLVTDVYQEAETATIKLESLKHKPGINFQEFREAFDETTKTVMGVQLRGDIPQTEFIDDLVDDLVHYIDKRFSNFNEEPLRCFRALDYRSIPQDRAQLVRYGTQEIKQLLTHMEAVFPKDTHLQILSEYANVKVFLRDLSQTDNSPSSIYKSLLKKPNIPNMRKLVELMLVISPSTAECERGFSQMKLIKTELRNSLTDDSLRILMTIKHHGPSLEDFNADRAINYWLGSCKGTRHVGGHAKHA